MKNEIKITTAEDFKGTKKTLSNITVRKYIDNDGHLQFMIFKGKGTGGQLTTTIDYDKVLLFNENFKSLVYKTIYANKDNRTGGAWFLNDEIFFPNEHPFVIEGGFHF